VTAAVDLADYVAAGYWLARPVARPPWFFDQRFVADPIASCSGCLLGGGAGPEVSWSSSFDEAASDLGVRPEKLPPARAWVADHADDVGHLHTWRSPQPLFEFVERFISPSSVMVLGLALTTERARAWGRKPVDAMKELLAAGQPPAPGGTVLGWEPVEWLEQGVGCSWTCNNLQPMVAQQLTLHVTDCGLLPDQQHADAVMSIVEHLPKEDGGDWEAFLLIRYGPEPRPPFRNLRPAACPVPVMPGEGSRIPGPTQD
jgi:hypothetical protein